MFESLKAIFFALLLGTSAVVGPTSQTIVAGETTVVASKPIIPSYDAIQVLITLGKRNDEIKKAIIYGKLTEKEIGRVSVRICKSDMECLQMNDGGLWIGNDTYGLSFWLQDKQVKAAKFSSIKIYTERDLPDVVVRWVNWMQ